METLCLVKIGGNIIDDEEKLSLFLRQLASLPGKKILVHGGGKLATRMAEQMALPQKMVDGRRITDAGTLRIVTMVYAGYINKNIVAQLHALDTDALGLCGADGNAIQAHKREKGDMDWGFAGDIDSVNVEFLDSLLRRQLTLVVAPITHNRQGQLLNTNADSIAQELAAALSSLYDTVLVYSFEKSGVLLDAENESSVIPRLGPGYYDQLKQEGRVFAGMIPKLDNAFAALARGVGRVIIGRAEELPSLIQGTSGTTISNE